MHDPSDKRIVKPSPKRASRGYGREAGTPATADPGFMLVRGQPRPQRCERFESATPDAFVVAPICAEDRERRGGWNPPATGPWTESPQGGYRRIAVQLSSVPPAEWAADGEGGLKQYLPRTLVNSGVVIGRFPVNPTPVAHIKLECRTMSSAKSSSEANISNKHVCFGGWMTCWLSSMHKEDGGAEGGQQEEGEGCPVSQGEMNNSHAMYVRKSAGPPTDGFCPFDFATPSYKTD